MQLRPDNSQVMSPNSPVPVQPFHPAPSTPPLALGVGAPVTPPSLASPQLSLVPRSTPMTPPIVSPRSPALSYERMQVFIQQSEDRASVYQARALSEQNLFTEKRELEEHHHGVRPWKVSTQKPTYKLSSNSTTSRQSSASTTKGNGKCCTGPRDVGEVTGRERYPDSALRTIESSQHVCALRSSR